MMADHNIFGAHNGVIVRAPEQPELPLVVSSPHAGAIYPGFFVEQSRLDAWTLRKSEDCFVTDLVAGVADAGAMLVAAEFPRAFVDVNRSPQDLDPAMFEDEIDRPYDKVSTRVASGLGAIPAVVCPGVGIYSHKLRFADEKWRLEKLHRSYHRRLESCVAACVAQFGFCLLVDVHSMPESHFSPPLDTNPGFVVGDCYGQSCSRTVTDMLKKDLDVFNKQVGCNTPYAGGYITSHYGRPDRHRHAIQLEINRSLYMDENSLARKPAFESIGRRLCEILLRLPDALAK